MHDRFCVSHVHLCLSIGFKVHLLQIICVCRARRYAGPVRNSTPPCPGRPLRGRTCLRGSRTSPRTWWKRRRICNAFRFCSVIFEKSPICFLCFLSTHVAQAPNGCVSHTKLVAALKECQALRPCFFTVNLDRDAAVFSMVLRILLSKFRSVQTDPRQKEVVRSKAFLGVSMIARRNVSLAFHQHHQRLCVFGSLANISYQLRDFHKDHQRLCSTLALHSSYIIYIRSLEGDRGTMAIYRLCVAQAEHRAEHGPGPIHRTRSHRGRRRELRALGADAGPV